MRKDINCLKEKLEPASEIEIKRLINSFDENPELKRMLTTPMGKIPQYRFLFSDEMADIMEQHPLLDLLRLFNYERRRNFFFSKSGDNFTGFIVYEDNGKIISDLKTASFYDDKLRSNISLARDLINFILDKTAQRQLIEWLVYPKNSQAICQYNRILDERGFQWKCVKSGSMLKYIVKGGAL